MHIEDIDKAVALYADNYSARQIAYKLSSTQHKVFIALLGRNCTLRPAVSNRHMINAIKHTNACRDNNVVDKYKAGATLAELSAQHGMSINFLRNYLVCNGLSIRAPNHGRPPAYQSPNMHKMPAAIALYKNGASLLHAGSVHGISPRTLRRHIVLGGEIVRPRYRASTLRTDNKNMANMEPKTALRRYLDANPLQQITLPTGNKIRGKYVDTAVYDNHEIQGIIDNNKLIISY